jgi:transcriptional regulator with XRE-family HTH domain
MAKVTQRSIRKQRERKIFLDLLRALRKQERFTQAQLAESIGAGQAFVSKYETGKVYLEFLDVVAICDALDIPIVSFAQRFESVRKSN